MEDCLWGITEVNPFDNVLIEEPLNFSIEQITLDFTVEASCDYIPVTVPIYLTVNGIFLTTVDGEYLRVAEKI